MSQFNVDKVVVLADAGTSLASAVTTKKIKLDNYQSVKVVVLTSAGTEEKTNLRLCAVLSDGTNKEIGCKEIAVGNKVVSEASIVANQLAHDESVELIVKIDAVKSSTNTCQIVALLSEARYAVEDDNPVSE